jgi:hypothetical protein
MEECKVLRKVASELGMVENTCKPSDLGGCGWRESQIPNMGYIMRLRPVWAM